MVKWIIGGNFTRVSKLEIHYMKQLFGGHIIVAEEHLL